MAACLEMRAIVAGGAALWQTKEKRRREKRREKRAAKSLEFLLAGLAGHQCSLFASYIMTRPACHINPNATEILGAVEQTDDDDRSIASSRGT